MEDLEAKAASEVAWFAVKVAVAGVAANYLVGPMPGDRVSRGLVVRCAEPSRGEHAVRKEQRSCLARRAATTRWSRQGRGVLKLAQIRDAVVKALAGRKAKVFLFGSYARREATPRSDVDLMVVLASLDSDWFNETAVIRGRLNFGRPIDLIVIDAATYEAWKKEKGSVQHEVARKGVRLV